MNERTGRPRVRAPGNAFGLFEAVVGLLAGFLLSILVLGAYTSAAHVPSGRTTFATIVLSLVALWAGFLGGALAATKLHAPAPDGRPGGAASGANRTLKGVPPGPAAALSSARVSPVAVELNSGTGSFVRDFGLRLRPWPDLALGVVVGVASQLLLVPALEAPLRPFVPQLSEKLGQPTTQLLGGISGARLVVIALLVCVGSPLVEEIFFRGLLLRSLLGRFAPLGARLGPASAIVVTALVFGLVHFEALQFLGLAGFGAVLCYLAYRTGRLGPSIVAHVAFNSTTVIWFVWHH